MVTVLLGGTTVVELDPTSGVVVELGAADVEELGGAGGFVVALVEVRTVEEDETGGTTVVLLLPGGGFMLELLLTGGGFTDEPVVWTVVGLGAPVVGLGLCTVEEMTPGVVEDGGCGGELGVWEAVVVVLDDGSGTICLSKS